MPVDQWVATLERSLMRKLNPAFVVRSNAWIHFRFGEPELHLLNELIEPGTVAIDVGAHFGTYSVPMARLVGSSGSVISIEPVEEDADMLRTAAKGLKLPIEVITAAISSESGEAKLTVPHTGRALKTALSSLEFHQPHGDERNVNVFSLDDLIDVHRGRVSFIKIDVEGHEIEVIRGARRVIKEHRPNLLIEIENRLNGGVVSEIFTELIDAGYRGEFLDKTRNRVPLENFDAGIHQNPSSEVLSRHYVNNFMFRPT